MKFISRLGDTVAIVTIDDEDQALRVLEVVSPQRTNLVLSPNIPHRERNVLVFDRFDVETCFGFYFVRGSRSKKSKVLKFETMMQFPQKQEREREGKKRVDESCFSSFSP